MSTFLHTLVVNNVKKHLWNGFTNIVKKEVVPALGCTEPVSVALGAAIAMRRIAKGEALNEQLRIEVLVSPNLMKNGMGVGVPGTGMVAYLLRLPLAH